MASIPETAVAALVDAAAAVATAVGVWFGAVAFANALGVSVAVVFTNPMSRRCPGCHDRVEPVVQTLANMDAETDPGVDRDWPLDEQAGLHCPQCGYCFGAVDSTRAPCDPGER